MFDPDFLGSTPVHRADLHPLHPSNIRIIDFFGNLNSYDDALQPPPVSSLISSKNLEDQQLVFLDIFENFDDLEDHTNNSYYHLDTLGLYENKRSPPITATRTFKMMVQQSSRLNASSFDSLNFTIVISILIGAVVSACFLIKSAAKNK